MIRSLIKIPIYYLDRLFVWAYGTELNPLRRSGALSVFLLTTLLVTGTYLIFFYSVASPYESMQEIQSQIYMGQWIRSFHRYVSDMAVIVVIYHSFSMLVQGRSWGPKTLAWISGIGLMCALFVSGWTGFVLVWDTHGQAVAQEGARILQLIPFLRDDLRKSFSGEAPIPGSFFFMNLFLHVVVPLGMILGLWIHTMKMGNVKLWPRRKVMVYVSISFLVLSILVPVSLLEKADLSRIVHEIPYDIWYNFFLPISLRLSPEMSAGVIFIGLVLMILVPIWSKPTFWGKGYKVHIPPFNEVRAEVYLRSAIVSIIAATIIIAGSQVRVNMSPHESLLRLILHLPNQFREECHKPTAEESLGRLKHMTPSTLCNLTPLTHEVQFKVDGKVIFSKAISNTKKDLRILKIYQDFPVVIGKHELHLSVLSKNSDGVIKIEKSVSALEEIELGQIKNIRIKLGSKGEDI